MDKIWVGILRSQRSMAVVVGMKKPNDHAELSKSNAEKSPRKKPVNNGPTNKLFLLFLYYSLLVETPYSIGFINSTFIDC